MGSQDWTQKLVIKVCLADGQQKEQKTNILGGWGARRIHPMPDQGCQIIGKRKMHTICDLPKAHACVMISWYNLLLSVNFPRIIMKVCIAHSNNGDTNDNGNGIGDAN